jgi:hypothetical protein
MTYSVIVKFRKNNDYSNANKNILIDLLQGSYKVPQEELNDMDQEKSHTFAFDKLEPAKNFASNIFFLHNKLFDVTTDFQLI